MSSTFARTVAIPRSLLLTFAATVLSAALVGLPATSEGATRLVSVIVQDTTAAAARADVESLGGRVTRTHPLIGGVTAEVPQDVIPALRTKAVAVTPNGPVGFQKAFDGSKTSHQLVSVTRSSKLWSQGVDGRGVTVALLDTGVYPHADLAGRVVHCEDFSHERNTEAHCADTFGHGTFMAGLIAGDGTSSGGKYRGSAPGASIVSVKLAGFDGSTDVSTVLAGIQWAVAHKDAYGIRVMNLSLGSDSADDYRLSPLNFAGEKAWENGIAVVVSAGNDGPDGGTITKPADDPWVITVGAQNHEGTLKTSDDMVPVFSGRGPTRSNGLAKPDLVAPGVHTVSLRSPGSAIDQYYGSTATVDTNYFKGTGTSMSAAYTSGAVAQVLQANPSLTPDQVKHRLMSTTQTIAETDPHAAGRGALDAYAAATSTSTAAANQGIDRSTGLGTIDASRGGIDVEVVTFAGQIDLSGEYVAQTDPDEVDLLNNPGGLVPYAGLTYTTSGWDPTSWDGTTWKDGDWAGTTWKGTTWKATVWSGTTWKGTTWKNADWDGTTWKGVDWDGTTWKGTTWKSKWYAAAWD